jgi:hypothetical protein
LLLIAVCLVACGKAGGGGDGESAGESTTGGTSTSTSTASTTTSASTTAATGESSGGLDETGGGGMCILWEPDQCPDAQKCMPWSELADQVPDDIICCDEVENPGVDGDPCEVTDYNGSCIDTCIDGTLCLIDDYDALTGICRTFCEPAGDDCDADHTCKNFFEMIMGAANVPLCMERCDPLAQDCPLASWHCIPDTPTPAGQSGFICVPPPEITVGLFDGCALANSCEKGNVCVTPERLPDCGSPIGCCTAFCSLAEGDGPCQALDPDLQCVDWMSPDPEWQDVGACVIPT